MALLAIFHAAIAGFMLFFMAVVPQAAFKTLSAQAVGSFLRVLFPRMFLFGLALSLAASGAAFAASEPRIVLLLLFFHPAMTGQAVCPSG